jgi:hypothetical protein
LGRFKIRSMSFLWLRTSCSQMRASCAGFPGPPSLALVVNAGRVSFMLCERAAAMVETANRRGDFTMSSMARLALHA